MKVPHSEERQTDEGRLNEGPGTVGAQAGTKRITQIKAFIFPSPVRHVHNVCGPFINYHYQHTHTCLFLHHKDSIQLVQHDSDVIKTNMQKQLQLVFLFRWLSDVVVFMGWVPWKTIDQITIKHGSGAEQTHVPAVTLMMSDRNGILLARFVLQI